MELYICNKADSERCFGCCHSFEHEKEDNGDDLCTDWSWCSDEDGNFVFYVRCVPVNSEEGQKVINNINNGVLVW